MTAALHPPALLAVSHGTSSAEGQNAVTRLVEAVARAAGVLVLPGHVDVQQPDVPAVLSSLPGGRAAVIVPLLLSAGFHVHVDLVNEAAEAARDDREVVVGRALGPDRRIAELLARRLAETGLRPGDSVVLGCAGSTDERAVRDCVEVAHQLGAIIHRTVSTGFISAAAPRLEAAIRAAKEEHPSERVVVSTYLLAPGFFNDLAHAMDADAVSDPLLVVGQAAPSELVEVVLDRYSEAVRRGVPAGSGRPLISHGGA
ncbi:MAG: hypothetical protein JWR01_1622 [Subtercola sp.]|nr:hypothetical protein [Subtercola sp.]